MDIVRRRNARWNKANMKVRKDEIELIMAKRGWTQKETVARCQISKSTFKRAMNGEYITPKTAGQIAMGLEVDLESLLGH